MVRPRVLSPGARIAIVSLASPFQADDLARGLDELRALGLDPVVDERIFQRHRYVSGPAEVRAAVLSDALDDDSVDAIMGARGGYGSVQLLPFLDPARIVRARKALVGYSDLTSILQFFALDCGLVSFHGPTAADRLAGGTASYHRESFERLLMRTDPPGELQPDGLEVLAAGEACGPLFGGTLTQICASLGTPFAFAPPDGYVLLVDEVNERPYRLDRMVTQLRLAGILARAAGVVFGELPGCDEPGGTLSARDVMAECLAGFGGPVLWGFPTGHTRGAAWTLPLGVPVRIVASSSLPKLVIEDPVVTA